MYKIIKLVLVLSSLFIANNVSAAPLNGEAIFEGGAIITPITGDIDVAQNTMSVDDWLFFGLPVITQNIELLPPGSYTRAAGDVTVPAGHIGAHIEVSWSVSTIYTYMVWDVTDSGATFTIIDSDNDGLPGHALTNGPFVGITIYYEFTTTPTGPPQPGVHLVLNVDGGNVQECTGDSVANVTVNAIPSLVGGTELDSISWTVDGNDAGTGLSISKDLALGSHVVKATALTTTGQSDIESKIIIVRDTTRPVLEVAFLDPQGNEVESSGAGKVEISIKIADSCDPDPVVTYSSAREETLVSDGSILSVNASLNNLKLPATSIRVTADGIDASGNRSFNVSKILTLE